MDRRVAVRTVCTRGPKPIVTPTVWAIKMTRHASKIAHPSAFNCEPSGMVKEEMLSGTLNFSLAVFMLTGIEAIEEQVARVQLSRAALSLRNLKGLILVTIKRAVPYTSRTCARQAR